MFRTIKKWLELSKKAHAKRLFNEKVKEINTEQQKWQSHFAAIKLNSVPIEGNIADIGYIDIDDLPKNRYVAEVADMILWINFHFDNGADRTIYCYQRPGDKQFENQRRMLEFSGQPSILEYGVIGSHVLGYFKGDDLVALETKNFTYPTGEEY